MKHVAGLPNSAGTRITVAALLRVQSARSGVTATEQIRTRAANNPRLSLCRIYRPDKPTVVSFVAVVRAVTLARGVKTAI